MGGWVDPTVLANESETLEVRIYCATSTLPRGWAGGWIHTWEGSAGGVGAFIDETGIPRHGISMDRALSPGRGSLREPEQSRDSSRGRGGGYLAADRELIERATDALAVGTNDGAAQARTHNAQNQITDSCIS